YRLISAQGREHIGQTAFDSTTSHDNQRDYPFLALRVNPNVPNALRNYTETYDYDEVGNINWIHHAALDGTWTRDYHYDAGSLIEPLLHKNNRLTSTTLGNGIF